jgi:Ca2+-binding EF-hand superfamily protein
VQWRYIAIGIGIACGATIGCGRAPSTPATNNANPVEAPAVAASVELPQAQPSVAPSAEVSSTPLSTVANAVAVEAATRVEAESAADKEAECEPCPVERIVVLTPSGPVVVDAAFMLGGRPHAAAFETLVKQVLDAGDTDNDGRSSWDELAANKEYLADYQPGGQPVSERQLKMWIEQYDENRDGQIQQGEAAGWLGRNTGTSARPFALRSSRWYRSNPRASSRVWKLLDSNRDARLSADELANAAERFFLFDANDDRTISTAELASLREQLDAANADMTAVSREATRHAAIHLDATVAVDQLEYVLTDLYSPHQTLAASSFRDVPALFGKLDVNSDDWLEQQELAGLRKIEPHLHLSIAFNATGNSQGDAAKLTLDAHAPDVAVLAQHSNRVVASVGNTRLVISAHDLAPSVAESPGQAGGPELQRSQVRGMIHDQCDAMFEELDGNSDGRLGEREIATGSQRLLSQDTDGDGQLGADELPHSMIVAFLRGEPANQESFYIPASEAAPSADEQSPPWFVRGDFNGDGDISRREFLGSLEQFRRLDTDQNGYIGRAEAVAFKSN